MLIIRGEARIRRGPYPDFSLAFQFVHAKDDGGKDGSGRRGSPCTSSPGSSKRMKEIYSRRLPMIWRHFNTIALLPLLLVVGSYLDALELSLPLHDVGPPWNFDELHAGTVRINSVFDHSTPSDWYAPGRDNVVVAFTGERGDQSCDPANFAWGKANGEEFLLNGHYTAAGLNPRCLYYDGHPGIDFRASTGTIVYAPASGTINVPTTDPVNGTPSKFNTLMIDHGDDWTTWYLHCERHLKTSGFVSRGEPIAEVGAVGTDGPHLHFEVRYLGTPIDPYGWQGDYPDPYTKETNHHLWAEAIKVEGDPRVYLLRRTYSNKRGKWETRKWHVTTNSGVDDSRFLITLDYSLSYIKLLTSAELDAYSKGPRVLAPGNLYRRPYFSNPDVFFIGDDRRSHLVSREVFEQRNFDDGDVYVCNSNNVFESVQANYYPVGDPLPPGPSLDCNNNRIDDLVDIVSGSSQDCNRNRIPDECDVAFPFERVQPRSFDVGEAPRSVVTVDLNGDGYLDLVAGNSKFLSFPRSPGPTLTVYLSRGPGEFQDPRGLEVGESGTFVVSGDFDGDGDDDVGVVSYNDPDTFWILWNRGTEILMSSPEFSLLTNTTHYAAAGDLNNDGFTDIVSATFDEFTVVISNGDGTFVNPVHYEVKSQLLSSITGIAIADLDGDGEAPEIIAVATDFSQPPALKTGVGRVFKNNGMSSFTPGVSFTVGPEPSSITTADLDRDNDLDIVVTNKGSTTVSLLYNDGKGGLSEPVDLETGTQPWWVTPADLDGDGWIDLAVAGSLLFNKGGTGFTLPVLIPSMGRSFIGSADINKDSYVDLMTVAYVSPKGWVSLWINDAKSAHGIIHDKNRTGIPDECELLKDCNNNGVEDTIDIANTTSKDCNGNRSPDECELSPPAWTSVGSMGVARRDHTATLLTNGKVLIVGYSGQPELYDPLTRTFSLTGETVFRRHQGSTANLLNDGTVLVIGGISSGNTAELYEPKSGTFKAVGRLAVSRSYHSATLLPDGKVLLAGGSDEQDEHASAEIYDPVSREFRLLTATLNEGRADHVAVALPNGTVLLAGGSYITTPGLGDSRDSAEIYNPVTEDFRLLESRLPNIGARRGILMPNGKVLIFDFWVNETLVVLFDPANESFTTVGALLNPHAAGTVTLLPNGQVLVAGGAVAVGPVVTDSAELFDPDTGRSISLPRMTVPRQEHTATLLGNGDVLLTGGFTNLGETASAELLVLRRIDCNSNGILDECDIANGSSKDNNRNGVPDECDGGELCPLHDLMGSELAHNIEIFGLGRVCTADLEGPVGVDRSCKYLDETTGRQTIDTTIVKLLLRGDDPGCGHLSISLQPDRPSVGKVVAKQPGSIFPAESHFDVYIKVEIPKLDLTLKNCEAATMRCVVNSLPPIGCTYQIGLGGGDFNVELYPFEVNCADPGIPVGQIVAADHTPKIISDGPEDCTPAITRPFKRGDCNGDGDTSGVTDAVFLLEYNFIGGKKPPCLAACDMNGDGDKEGVTDAIYILEFNFLGKAPPPPPFLKCDSDRTCLTCDEYTHCRG